MQSKSSSERLWGIKIQDMSLIDRCFCSWLYGILYFFFSSKSLGHVVPLNVRSYVSTTTCLMWLSICSSFYNTLEDTSWNRSSFIRVDGNRVRLVYHFLLRFLTVLHMNYFLSRLFVSIALSCSIYWFFEMP